MISIDHACVLHIQSRHVPKIIYLWLPCTKLMAYTWIFLPAARKFSFFLYSNQSFIWRTCQTLIWTFGQPHVLIMEANLGTLTPACRYMHLFSFTWRTHGHHSPPNILKNIIRPVHKHPFNQETLLSLIALNNFFFSGISLTKIWCHHLHDCFIIHSTMNLSKFCVNTSPPPSFGVWRLHASKLYKSNVSICLITSWTWDLSFSNTVLS